VKRSRGFLVDAHGAGSLMAGFPGDIRVTCRLPRLEGKRVWEGRAWGRGLVEEEEERKWHCHCEEVGLDLEKGN